MPVKTGFPPLPYLDPQLNPDHPDNKPIIIDEDPYLPLGKRERNRRMKIAREAALETYEPPHVLRSWETHAFRAAQRRMIFGLILPPKTVHDYEDLLPNPNRRSQPNEEQTDFRAFAVHNLHLGYNRFHASQGEPHVPSEETDVVPPEDVCWIMEYTYTECNNIRRQLAYAIGEYPAVTDQENPSYIEDIAWRYDRRLYCRCRRRNKRCIRPSHIEIFTSLGHVLP